ncbi:MAG TPA: hypothetical protein VIU14_13130 [Mesorhizobium sp.]
MQTHVSIGIALAFVTLTATGAGAQELKKYGSEAGWDIFIKQSMGPGCLVAKKLNAEAQLQMGISATAEKKGYIALYTKKDAAVAAGDKVSVLFDVDGQQFSGVATGQQIEGMDGAFVWVNNPDFIYDLAKKNALTITPAGRDPIVLSLKGTDAAFTSLRTCQDAQ